MFDLQRDDGGPSTDDEDSDGVRDVDDLCPHIANESPIDRDGDRISIDCDPDDNDGTTESRFLPLTAGSLDNALRLEGIGGMSVNGFVLGSQTGFSALTFGVDTGTVLVDLGFEIQQSSVENALTDPWAEIGIISVHRAFTSARDMRGDVCFLGVALAETPPVMVGPAYLEMNEDDQAGPTVTFPSPLNGEVGRLRHVRTPQRIHCSVVRPQHTPVENMMDVTALATTTGAVAISAQRMVANLTYLWIAWQP